MAAPTVQDMSFDNDIFAPLAQVTVIDGNEGDCNVVDFCRLPLMSGDYQDGSWRRTVIDTGPSGGIINKPVGQAITNTLVNVTTMLSFPKLDSQPLWDATPPVSELQITHPDDDHIGNASAYVDAMCKNQLKYIEKATVAFCQIPDLYCKPTIEEGPIEKDTLNSQYVCSRTYTAIVDGAWQKKMEQAGFSVRVSCYPALDSVREWELTTEYAEWDDDTKSNPDVADRCTIYYVQKGAKQPLTFDLIASISVYLPDGDLLSIATLKSETNKKGVTTKWYQATVSRNKKALGSFFKAIPLTPTQQKKLDIKESHTIDSGDWLAAGKKQKGGGLNSSLLMGESVVLNTEVQPPLVGSVQQVVSLGTKIQEMNKSSTINAKLKPLVRYQGMITRPVKQKKLNQASGQQYTIGPSLRLYQNMMRDIMLNRYALDAVGALNDASSDNTVEGDVINRSSTVTMFERHDKSSTPAVEFSMLFTGDAFDASCDIRDTLISWNPGVAPPGLQLDVLKIPHHGSDRTADSGFYRYCRAYVYIVSGDHANTSGNPKVSTLKAIVSSFKNRTAPGSQPFRLFFSNVNADKDWTSGGKAQTSSRSAAKALLADDDFKPSATYNYEMYKLKTQSNISYAACGSILFGKDNNGDLKTTWDTNSWVEMT